MRNFISENNIEQAILSKLKAEPFKYDILVFDSDLSKRDDLNDGTGRKSKKECVLPDVMLSSLKRINPTIKEDKSELLPLLEAGASWEVPAFASQIYLPSSSGSPCPVFFYFSNIPLFLFQCFLYSMLHCNLYQFQSRSTHIYNFFLIISVSL